MAAITQSKPPAAAVDHRAVQTMDQLNEEAVAK
jgi:hypothetical protein